MIEIISKPNGPRREDVAAKRFLRDNASTINKIANQLSGGRLGANLQTPPPAPAAVRRERAAPSRDAEKRPYTSVSLNGRVIVVDFNTGRQLHHIGEFRGKDRMRRLVLATRENRFFTSLDDELLDKLRDLDGAAAPDDADQEELVQEIDRRLGIAGPGPVK